MWFWRLGKYSYELGHQLKPQAIHLDIFSILLTYAALDACDAKL